MINIFIGYDSKERVAYNVLSHSIIQNSTKPVAITPIALNHLRDDFVRERNALSSTEFSFSRFMIPHLMNYQGWALRTQFAQGLGTEDQLRPREPCPKASRHQCGGLALFQPQST